MANFNNSQHYQPPPGGGPPAQPQTKQNSFKKGLGFIPNAISRSTIDPIEELLRNAPSTAKGQCAVSEREWDSDKNRSTHIPLFDLGQMSQASGEERARLIQSFGAALTEVGFIGINAENLMPLINSVYTETPKYFHQPFDKKLPDWQSEAEMQGFSYQGCEIAIKAPKPDLKESFFIPSNFSQWPSGMPSFARVMSEYHAVLTEYSKYLVNFLMEYLDQTHENMEETISNARNVLRLAYYPSIKPDDDHKALWAAPRLDRSVLTITTPGTIPGLQFYSSQGQWQHVVVPKGYLIVNTGKLLQHKTAGLIRARWHRVINPGGQYTRMERFSGSFFAFWPEDYTLGPFDNCVGLVTKGMSDRRKLLYLKKYADITVSDKMHSKRTPASV